MSQSANPDRRLPVATPRPRAEGCSKPRPVERVLGEYGAHLHGQAGVHRGLKAGATAIEQAHCAYQGAEWSGFADRRRLVGGQAKLRA